MPLELVTPLAVKEPGRADWMVSPLTGLELGSVSVAEILMVSPKFATTGKDGPIRVVGILLTVSAA